MFLALHENRQNRPYKDGVQHAAEELGCQVRSVLPFQQEGGADGQVGLRAGEVAGARRARPGRARLDPLTNSPC